MTWPVYIALRFDVLHLLSFFHINRLYLNISHTLHEPKPNDFIVCFWSEPLQCVNVLNINKVLLFKNKKTTTYNEIKTHAIIEPYILNHWVRAHHIIFEVHSVLHINSNYRTVPCSHRAIDQSILNIMPVASQTWAGVWCILCEM